MNKYTPSLQLAKLRFVSCWVATTLILYPPERVTGLAMESIADEYTQIIISRAQRLTKQKKNDIKYTLLAGTDT